LDWNGPAATIQPPGLMEIKAEEKRAAICSTQDLLQDASFNVEGSIQRKAARAVRQKLAATRMSYCVVFRFSIRVGGAVVLARRRASVARGLIHG
jgi:hypothetical protein